MSATSAAAALGITPAENPPLGPRKADPVAELGKDFDAPDAEVGLLAGGDAADRCAPGRARARR